MGLKKISSYERRYDVDWLRVIAIFTLFLYHSAKAFDMTLWHIKNDVQSLGMTIFVAVLSAWIMPLFFILSGMSIYYSLRKREAGQFIRERVMRIMVPYLFGIFGLLYIHVYYEALFWGYEGSFFKSYPLPYFTLEVFPWHGIYLWYLFYLFIFSLVALPFFMHFRKEENREKITNFMRIINKPGAIFLLLIPLIITEIVNRVMGLDTMGYGGWQIPSYFVILIYGYLFASYSKSNELFEKNIKIAVVIAPIASFISGAVYFAFFNILLFGIFWPLAGLSWLIIILGIGSRKLNFNHERLGFLNEIVLPLYILHQTVIVVVDYYVVSLDTVVIVKYLLVIALALPITLGLVMLVRTNNVTRFLFGMRLKKRLHVSQ